MRGQGRNPRGWRTLDPYEGEIALERPAPPCPWIDPPATETDTDRFKTLVRKLPKSSARSLLVVLSIPGMDVAKACDWERQRPKLVHRADALLSRFPAGTHFYSNIGWKGDPYFYEQGVWGGLDPFSCYGWDAGLIAVNDDEVALFWNFQNT
jgi:hypothetical protein